MSDAITRISTPYITTSTSSQSDKVEKVFLAKTTITSRYVEGKLIRNEKNPKANVEITLVHERHEKQEENDLPAITNVAHLKMHEWAKCNLDSEQTLKLYQMLSDLYALSNKGVGWGKNKYIILEVPKNCSFSKKDEESLSLLLSKCKNSPQLAKKLVDLDPEFVECAHKYRLLQKKIEGIAQFKVMLEQKSYKESDWENFFYLHDWILGGIRDVQILGIITRQPRLSGSNIYGKGEKKGDLLLKSLGHIHFTVPAEIKTPYTKLLKPKRYRNHYVISDELLGGVTQLRKYLNIWETNGSRTDANRDLLEKNNIYTIQPTGILIIGNLDEIIEDREMRFCFQSFRQQQKDIQIVTFDEVYNRALYLSGQKEDEN